MTGRRFGECLPAKVINFIQQGLGVFLILFTDCGNNLFLSYLNLKPNVVRVPSVIPKLGLD